MIADLIVMHDGMKIFPVEIEHKIKSIFWPSFLSNVVLIGNDRKHLTCLLTLKVKTCLTNKMLVVLLLYTVCYEANWRSYKYHPTKGG